MIKLLTGGQILESIKRLATRTDKLDLGVAFWGKDAVSRLGLDHTKAQLRILCDLESGACNPKAMLELLGRPNTHIKSINGFHAKVYLSSSAAVVGSANASANGLGEEDDEAHLELEAAVLTLILRFLVTSTRGLSAIGAVPRRSKLTEAQFWRSVKFQATTEMRVRDASRARGRSCPCSNSQPDWFRDRRIRLIAYDDVNRSRESDASFERSKKERYSSSELEKYSAHGEVPIYEDDIKWLRPGEFVIDNWVVKNNELVTVKKTGLWQVKTNNWYEYLDNGRRRANIFLDKVGTAFGLGFPKNEQRKFANRIEKYFQTHPRLKADRHGCLIDMPLSEVPRYFGWANERSNG